MEKTESRGKKSREVLTFESMLAEQRAKKATRVYKVEAQEAAAESIKQSIALALTEMEVAERRGKIQLADTEAVKMIAREHLLACQQTGTIPSMIGLSRCLGYTAQGLYWYMRDKPEAETTKFLRSFQELCSDLLSMNSLKGNTHPIVSIFLQKALYGLRDTVTLETVPADNGNPEGEQTAADYARRYGHLLEE